MDFNNQWIEIFKAGDYGKKGKWSPADVAKVVENFMPKTWQAPAVFGHPEHDAPAMGQVKELRADGAKLLARFEKVHPALEASVADGRYPNHSAAFYLNPLGQGPMLRHVGFLGAMPPEIKGLAPIQFSDGEFVAIDYSEEDQMDANEIRKTVSEEVRGFFAKLFGERPAASTFTEEQVQERVEAALKPLETKFDELKTQLTEDAKAAEKRANDAQAQSAKAQVAAFIEKLKAENHWVPAFDEAEIPAALESLALSAGTIKFGEPGKEKEVSLYDTFKSFLEGLPKIVPTGAIAAGAKPGTIPEYNEAKGIELDPESVAVNTRAEQIAREQKVEFGEALKTARTEVAQAGSAAAKA